MATITFPLERIEGMGWSTYKFRVDGHDFIGLTSETGEAAAQRLKAICDLHSEELLNAVLAVNERRQWNMDHPGQGRDWPAFRQLDKLRARLLKQAHIKDT